MKRLIVNADDFGRTAGINAGVLEGHLSGIVTSATVMVLEPAAEEGVAEALRRAPRLSLGLHCVLTGGGPPASPAERIPSLLTGGAFSRFPKDLPDALPADEVATELEAQIAIFEKLAGRPPAHLDSHHHSALHPSIQPAFADAARRRGIPVRASSESAREELRRSGVKTPDRFIDGFYAEGATAESLRAILESLPDGASELMCHPGRPDERLLAGSSYARERERELAILCDPGIREVIVQCGIDLIGFGEL